MMAEISKGDVPNNSIATNPSDQTPTVDANTTTPVKDAEMEDVLPTNTSQPVSTPGLSKTGPSDDVEMNEALPTNPSQPEHFRV